MHVPVLRVFPFEEYRKEGKLAIKGHKVVAKEIKERREEEAER